MGPHGTRREIVNAANVRMTHRTSEQELLTERLVVARHARLFAHHLERRRLLRRAVVSEEHLAHAAFAEALADLVAVVDDRALAERGRIAGRHRRGRAPAGLRRGSVLDLARSCNVLRGRSGLPVGGVGEETGARVGPAMNGSGTESARRAFRAARRSPSSPASSARLRQGRGVPEGPPRSFQRLADRRGASRGGGAQGPARVRRALGAAKGRAREAVGERRDAERNGLELVHVRKESRGRPPTRRAPRPTRSSAATPPRTSFSFSARR